MNQTISINLPCPEPLRDLCFKGLNQIEGLKCQPGNNEGRVRGGLGGRLDEGFGVRESV